MFLKLYIWIRKHLLHIDDRSAIEIAIANGLKIGKNHHIMEGCIIDPGHCFLITIGDNVTLAPRVHILAHDASTKMHLGYAVVGRVSIGNNTFIGAGSIVLPNVTIGDNVIIGAGSVVSKSIPSNTVAVGVPARPIGTTSDYIMKRKSQMDTAPCYDKSYKIDIITPEKKQQMLEEIRHFGFIE